MPRTDSALGVLILTVEPSPENGCFIFLKRHTAFRPGNITAPNVEMNHKSTLAPRLGVRHAIDIDVPISAHLDDGHSEPSIPNFSDPERRLRRKGLIVA
jgi:hypothetical protein